MHKLRDGYVIAQLYVWHSIAYPAVSTPSVFKSLEVATKEVECAFHLVTSNAYVWVESWQKLVELLKMHV
jgi:ABC-type thiamine transport system substrate-binding protein